MIEIISKFYYTDHIDVKNTKLKKYYLTNYLNNKVMRSELFVSQMKFHGVTIYTDDDNIFLCDVPDEFKFFTLKGEFFIYLRFLECILMPETNKITIDEILNTKVNRRGWEVERINKEIDKKVFTLNLINSLDSIFIDSNEKTVKKGLTNYTGFLLFKNLNTGEKIECYYESDEYDYKHIAFEDMTFPIELNIYEYKRLFIKNIIEWMII